MWTRSPWTYALAGLALVLGGLWLTVHYNYGGDATALFYTGSAARLPASLGEEPYRAPDAVGFDGQFYHLIAHDPFLTKGYGSAVDNPRLRWRRALVPLTAHVFAFGRDRWVDTAYIGVIAMFTFFGLSWLGRIAQERGLHPACGLLFLTIPSAFMSLERMTVDGALVALTAAFVLYARKGGWRLWAALALVPLARETGLILTGGYCGFQLLQRDFRRFAWYSASAIPFLAWSVFVQSRTPPDATPWYAWFPFSGLIERTLDPAPYELTGRWVTAAAISDYLGILGIWLAVAATIYLVWKQPRDPLVLACGGFAVLAALLGKADVWQQAYGFSRIFSPWFVCLAALAINRKFFWLVSPWALNIPRVAIQTWVHLPAILAGLAGRS
jgi:hypothetical protein